MAVSPVERPRGASASRLGWYLRRLEVMSGRERLWRVGNVVRMAHRRYQFRRPLDLEDSAAILCPDLLMVTPRFPQNAERWSLPAPACPHQNRSYMEQLGQGKWLIFGDTVTLEPPDAGQWQRDPISEKAWARKFGPSVKLVSPDVPGEYRVTWELNRLAFCYLLVAPESPWRLDEGIARCEQLVSSWTEGNPVYWGVNWSSAMEAAIRILHLCWTLVAVYQHNRSEGERLLQAWWPLLCAHAGFTRDRISLYSSANNHLIMELAALLTISAFASTPDSGGEQYVKVWEDELARQLDRQFDGRGVNQEHSTDYQRFVMQALELLDASGIIHSLSLRDKLQRVVEHGHAFLSALGADGESFTFGDSDGGVLFAGWSWQNGEDAGLAADEEPVVDISGYLIGQAGEWRVFLDAADDGLPPMYGHAHSDLFSAQMCLGGQKLVGDPGTYVYATDVPLRHHLRSRRAHSVFGPTDWEPFQVHGSFLVEPARGLRRSLVAHQEDWCWLWAQHDYHPDLVLERAVLCHPHVGCLVFDLAVNKVASGKDDITSWTSRFQLAEGWQAKHRADGSWHLITGHVNQDVVVQFSAPMSLDQTLLLRSFSPAFTRLTRLPALTATARGPAPVMLVTSFTRSRDCPEITWEDQTCEIDMPELLVTATLQTHALSVQCRSKDVDQVVSFSGLCGEG